MRTQHDREYGPSALTGRSIPSTVDRVVNNMEMAEASQLRGLAAVIAAYVAVSLGTVAALGVLAALAPSLATQDAWVHAVLVAVFAVVLPLRLRSARRGSVPALRAVGIVSAVVFLVNVVEVMIPGLFPAWMRIEMLVIALLMAASVLLVVLTRLASQRTSQAGPAAVRYEMCP
jgi:uncharacterized membrane protein